MTTHTVSVLVENKPAVLTRVAGLFSRRGFNIESLAVGPTEHPEVSRITILVSVEGAALDQVVKQLDKLVNVLSIAELEESRAVQREILLVKVGVGATRAALLDVVAAFGARLADDGPAAATVELSGHPTEVAAMLSALAPFGILEMVQSGVVALGRGPDALARPRPRPPEAPQTSYAGPARRHDAQPMQRSIQMRGATHAR